jgi:AcrR family transcriptional regulator
MPKPLSNVLPAKQQRSRDKRDQLIKAGKIVFGKQGYEQTRMVDIALQAEVSVGVLYQRFRNKRALFDVAVQELAEQLEAEIDEFFDNVEPATTVQALMEELVATLVDLLDREAGFLRALITFGNIESKVLDRLAAVDRYRVQRLAKFLTTNGLLSPGEADEQRLYFALATAIRMLMVTATVDRAPIRLRSAATTRELAMMLVRYLGFPN